MAARLQMDIETERAKLESLAAGYRMAGAHRLEERAKVAAIALRNALSCMADYDNALADARNEEETH